MLSLYLEWKRIHPKLKQRRPVIYHYFFEQRFCLDLTVLACYQLVNVDESDLENPEMYFWAANLFLRGNGQDLH